MIQIRNNNDGVILVLTLIIMSVLLATAITFAVFIISDIKQAKSIDDSITAYYAADTGIEASLFQFRKGWISSTADLFPNSVMPSNNSTWDVSKSTDTEDVIVRQRLYNGQSIKLFFLNRDNGGNPVNRIGIVWKSNNSNMQVNFTQLIPQFNDANQSLVYYTDQSKYEAVDSNLAGATCYEFKDLKINEQTKRGAPSDYVVEIKALGLDGDYIENLKVQAYKGDDCSLGNRIDGAISNIAIVSNGKQNQSVQQVTAQIPPKDPVSGISSFVLFSEEDITKQ